MKVKERIRLVKLGQKLHATGIQMEQYRDELRKLVEQNAPYHSSEMREALERFQATEAEWKSLECAYLEHRARF